MKVFLDTHATVMLWNGDVVAKAMDLHWTRDPFDRLLVATAVLHKAPFVTRDQKILEHFDGAVW